MMKIFFFSIPKNILLLLFFLRLISCTVPFFCSFFFLLYNSLYDRLNVFAIVRCVLMDYFSIVEKVFILFYLGIKTIKPQVIL